MATENLNLCVQIYSTMSFGEKKIDVSEATEWLAKHKYFDCWIDGKYIRPQEQNNYSEAKLGGVTCLVQEGNYGAETAVNSSVAAQQQWVKLTLLDQLRMFQKISSTLKTKRRLFSDLCGLQGQKDDFELFLDYFNYYSSLLSSEYETLRPSGVVLLILSCETPNWFLAATFAAALWAGCSIIIKPSRKAPFFPFLLAEICSKAGLPNGLINVVPGSQYVADCLLSLNVDKVVFHGNYKIGCCIRHKIIHKDFSMFHLGHTAFIIFDSCDVDAAADKLFSETWKFGEQSSWNADLVLVHESIYDVFLTKLTSKMMDITKNKEYLKKAKKNYIETVEEILARARHEKVQVFSSADKSHSDRILVTHYDIDTCDYDIPITKLIEFKNVKEALDIVNKASYGLGTSIWTQNVAQSMEVATRLETCTTWINCHGVINASVPVKMLHKSGSDALGGLEGGLVYKVHKTYIGETSKENFQLVLDKTDYELIRGKAEKLHEVFMKWKLNNSRREFLMKALDTMKLTLPSNNGNNHFIDIINFWSLTGNSYDVMSATHENNLYTSLSKKPVGVIAMVLHERENIIETFFSWVTPAIAMGNVVIVVIDQNIYPSLEPVIQCFVNKLPNGVVEIVQGLSYAIELAKDSNVKAIWIQNGNYALLKNLCSSDKLECIWSPPSPAPLSKILFANHCLKTQAIWLPTIYSPA